MSSRYLHPLACRLPRKERNAIDEIARTNKMSVSALTKEALRRMLFGVHPGVNMPSNIEFRAALDASEDNLSRNGWREYGRAVVPATPLKKSTLQPAKSMPGNQGGLWRE